MYEVSQESDDEAFCLFNNIAYFNDPSYERTPQIVLIGHGSQFGTS